MRPLLLLILVLAVSPLSANEQKTPERKPNSKPSPPASRHEDASTRQKSDTTKKTQQRRLPQLPDRHQIDADVARVKQQMGEIQKSSTPKDQKIEAQRNLLHREVARAEALKQEILSGDTKQDVDAKRDRRKAALDNIQKLLDILRSMNPHL